MFEALRELIDWMPVAATSWAKQVDLLNDIITLLGLFFTILLPGLMLYFMIKYRRRSPDQPTAWDFTHSTKLEIFWTGIPALVCVALFLAGFHYYQLERTPPKGTLDINVEGMKWAWNIEYPTGRKSTNELVVPVNKPIKLILTSRDVNHSFFIPSMRIKEDAVKDTFHYLWFTPEVKGEFPVFCAEYCGTSHSLMRAVLKVVDEAEYQKYVNPPDSGTKLSPLELGRKLYQEKACSACHSLDGSRIVGPSFKGIFGHEVELEGGSKVVVDENYVRESILNPSAKVVLGFPPVMPPFQGQLSDDELKALIAFVKSQA